MNGLRNRCRSSLAILGLSGLLAAQAEGAAMYTVTDLGPRQAVGLNNAGQVAFTEIYDQYTPIPALSLRSPNYDYNGAYTRAVRYDSYGPNAGRIVDVGAPLDSPGAASAGGKPYVTSHEAQGINNQGQVLVDNKVLSDGATTTPAAAGGSVGRGYESQAMAINDRGQVAVSHSGGIVSTPGGVSTDWAATFRGYRDLLYDPQTHTSTDLGTIAGIAPYIRAINNSGQMTGTIETLDSSDRFLYQHAVVSSAKGLIDLGSLGGKSTESQGLAINDAGQVVGYSQLSNGTTPSHAFLYSGGVMHDLTPGPVFASVATSINSSGQIVGGAQDDYGPKDPGRAVIFQGGTMVDLNSLIEQKLAIHLDGALKINDVGQILAVGHDQFWGPVTFLLTPSTMPAPATPQTVPEPTALATILVGALGLALMARRRQGSTR